jgi:transposase-like protein
MPWLETAPMDERIAFITDHRQGLYPVTELCARYGISRKTGYKWLDRFEVEGRRGLADRSRAPHHCPTVSPPSSPTCSAPRGGSTPTGVPASSWTSSSPGTRRSTGPPSAP